MQELQKDSKVIRAARSRLVPGETVLWASTQRGLGRRGLLVVGATLSAFLVMWTFIARGEPTAFLAISAIFSPFLIWWLAEMMARSFVATDRRVIFISRLWPYRWSYWNYAEMDAPLVLVGRGKKIIHLRHFALRASGEPAWVTRGAVYPGYIEQVPDIESVRDLILEQIAIKPTPVEERGKTRGPRRRIYGTRSG